MCWEGLWKIMAVIEMKKVSLIGMRRDKEGILKLIQSIGNLEIIDIEEQRVEEDKDGSTLLPHVDSRPMEELESQLSKIGLVLELLNKYKPIKKGMFDMKPQVTIHDLSRALSSREKILKAATKCIDHEEGLSDISVKENRLKNLISQMEPLQALDIPIEKLKDTDTTRVFLGTVNKASTGRFKDAIGRLEDMPLVMRELGETREDTCIFIIYHISIEDELRAILNEFSFLKLSLSGLSGTPKSIINNSESELTSLWKLREDTEKSIAEFSDFREDFELLYDALLVEMDRFKAVEKLGETQSTFLLRGWVPERYSKGFVSSLTEKFEDTYIELSDPEPDEDFPVALDNPSFVSPFEMVTDLYSTPNPRELDPNSVMAPFYAIFFGLMMGDAGYGLIMALGTYWFLKKLKPKGGTKKLVSVIFIGSIFTFIWGAIFGGWFGNAGELLGVNPIWFNPAEEPIKMLIVCFGLGIIHVFAGIGVKAYVNIKEGRILDAIFDQGLWYVFYIGLILWLAGGMAGLEPIFSKTGMIMSIVGGTGLVLTQGREKKNIFAKFFSGLLSLYDVTGFLSDILSYSRLFALALTTGVIGTVMNQLGLMVATSWYGWIIAMVIFAIGHTFNIAINVLGTFVHTSRLQYIEFYGKFYQGGGRSFKPLNMKTKYGDLKDEA